MWLRLTIALCLTVCFVGFAWRFVWCTHVAVLPNLLAVHVIGAAGGGRGGRVHGIAAGGEPGVPQGVRGAPAIPSHPLVRARQRASTSP